MYEHFRTDVFKQLPIDNNAKVLARNFFIPLDENLYINKHIITDVSKIVINTESITTIKKCNIQGGTDIKQCKGKHNDPECYTFTPTPIESFWDSIVFQSAYQVIDDVADVVERKFYKIKLRKIKDGCKHKTFPVMRWTLMKLNPHLSLNQITSFMCWFNKNYTNSSPMLTNKLIAMVQTATGIMMKQKCLSN